MHGRTKMLAVIAIEYPPFTTETQADKGSSFRALQKYLHSKQLEFELQPLFLPPARAQSEILAGHWCLSFYPPPDIVREESHFVLLSDSYVHWEYFVVVKKPHSSGRIYPNWQGGKLLCFVQNKMEAFLQQFTNAGLTVEFVSDISTGLKMLSKGRVDYAFGDSDALSVLSLPKDVRNDLQFSSTHLMEVPEGVFVNSTCPEADEVLATVSSTH